MNVPGPGFIPVITPGASAVPVSGMVAAAFEHVASVPAGAPPASDLVVALLLPVLEPLLAPELLLTPELEPPLLVVEPELLPELVVFEPLLLDPLLVSPPVVPPSPELSPCDGLDEQPVRSNPATHPHPAMPLPRIRMRNTSTKEHLPGSG
jgi:hypothetical protein